MYQNLLKPIFDFTVALIVFVLILPVFLLVLLALTLANKGRPFFTQLRPGKNEKIFKVIKFKTMNDACGANGELLSDGERLTKIGQFVRKTSLDELPQLLNVLKGDMSLIGPRPLLVEYLPLYSKEQNKRHQIKPGITGWAQVNGRNAISWTKKFELDVYYVTHCTAMLDLQILFLTIKKVLVSEGIAAEGEVTITKFKG